MEDKDYLLSFRKQIDRVDHEIMILLKRRFQLAKKIAKYKITNNMEVLDLNREDAIYQNLINTAISMQISESFTRRLFDLIITESKAQQQKFIEKRGLDKEE